MSRTRIALAGLACTIVGCTAPATDSAPPASSTTVEPLLALPMTTTTSTTTTTTTSTTTTSTTTTSTVAEREATPEAKARLDVEVEHATVERCSLADVEIEEVLVFGNSTDYTFRPDERIDMTAWPELLTRHDDAGLLNGVIVRNEAQPGQTMGTWDAWGPDPRLRMVVHATSVLEATEPTTLEATLALVAPSFIDLQENGFDPERAIADLSVVLDTLAEYGVRTLVLPMNYVSTSLNDRLPDLNPAIDEFNRSLAEDGGLAPPLADSALRSLDDDDGIGGDDRFYDEFPGLAKDGTFRGADGFHPDDDGHAVKAADVVDALTTFACPLR